MSKIFINPEGHQHSISGLKVMVILLKGWILPIGGVASGLKLMTINYIYIISLIFKVSEIFH